MSKIKVHYVTSSAFKKEENRVLCDHCTLRDGTRIGDRFEFVFRDLQIKEMLEVDLEVMVRAEVISAYRQLRVPCIVEHAGLIFDEYEFHSYPGGLTKPMWNTLGERFIKETGSGGRKATARAVVAFCDGMSVKTFVGETHGTLTEQPRGRREFYWDTVFVPDDQSGRAVGKTYAEIVEDPALSIAFKVAELSQSTKAMIAFLEYRLRHGASKLWDN